MPLQGSPKARPDATNKRPSASLQASANLALHGAQDNMFVELDTILSERPDQGGDTESLLKDINSVLDGSRRRQEAVSSGLQSWEEAQLFKEGIPAASLSDADKLFSELEVLMRDVGEDEKKMVAALDPIQKEVMKLLTSVASDSELLAKNYPLNAPPEEDLPKEPRKPRELTPEEKEKVAALAELDRILQEEPELVEQHRELTDNHAARMARLVDLHGRKFKDVRQVATNLLNGVEDDQANNKAHQAHLDWHKSTLAMMQTQRGGLGAGGKGASFGGARPSGGRPSLVKGRPLQVPAKGPQGQVLRDGQGQVQMMTIHPRKR